MAAPKLSEQFARRGLRAVKRHSLATLLASTALGVVSAHAVDATWTGGNAGDPNEWTEPANWTGGTVPDGTATLSTSATTGIDSNGIINIGRIQFTAAPNAPAYTINTFDLFMVNGTGVFNDSTNTQTFNVTSSTLFQNSSAASGGSKPVTYVNTGFMTLLDSSTAGTAIITNNSVLSFNATSTAGTAKITNNVVADFFDSSNAGTANITNAAGATLTFHDASTASGATIGNSGDVAFLNSSTAGSANITNATGSTLSFSNSSAAGSSQINTTGTGVAITFNDSSSAGNATFTANASTFGTITFNNTSTASNAHIDLVDTNLVFNNSSTAGNAIITMSNVSHPGNIAFNNTSSAGNANITNVGVTTLGTSVRFLDASTAANATITNNPNASVPGQGGVLQFGILGGTDTANAGSATIVNNQFGSASFFANTSAMNASITNNSGGATNFQDQATAANATIVNNAGGTTQFGVPVVGTDTATAGSAHITNHAGGTTEFTAQTTAGSAIITNDAGGFLQFGDSGIGSSTATAGSSTIANNGTTSFNANTTAGTSTITTGSGGNVFFFDSSTGGSARFITNAGGTFDMSGLTAVGMSAGSIEGAGSYILGSKSLTVGSNNLSTTVSGVISGPGGSLAKVGTGTLTLTGINTYTGATTVNGGALVVDGSTALSILTTVNAGGILAGSGIVGNTAINGGTLAPGSTVSAFGPLTVNGNLSFTAASTYMIQVSPTNAGRTNVSGTATLGNATVNVNYSSSTLQSQYTILNATTGVSGTFNPTVVSNNSNVTSTLTYDAHNVFLNTQLNFTPPGGGGGSGGGLTVNQQNVANALTGFFNRTGSIPMAFAALSSAGLTVASGELGTGVIQSSIKAADLFLNLLLDPTIAGRSGGFTVQSVTPTGYTDEKALAYAAMRSGTASERDAYAMATKAPMLVPQALHRWSIWASGYGGSETVGGNTVVGSQDLSARVWGVASGADYKVSPDTLIGFALGGGGTNYSLANGLGGGRTDMFNAGFYGRQNFGNAYLSGAFAYGWHDVTTNRTVALAGVDMLQGRFRAETFSGRFEGGYRFATPFLGITPYAAAQVISFNLPNYAEVSQNGGGLFALNYASQTVTDTRTELGLRGDKSFAMADGVLTLRSRAAWAHDYDPNRAVTAIFQALPGASFVVNGARPDADSALVSASAERKWLNGFSVAGVFEGEFSGNVTSYAGKGVVKYSW
jgi:autotransporter-associated beta strand protein